MKQYEKFHREVPIEEIKFEVVGEPEYCESIYDSGIYVSIIVTDYQDQWFLIDGNRRVASQREAYNKALGDGTLQDRPWLLTMPVDIYKDMPPTDQAALSFIVADQRSDNDFNMYLKLRAAKERGDQEEVIRLAKINKQKLRKWDHWANLKDGVLDLWKKGRISKGNLEVASKLGGTRQDYLLELAATKGEKPIVASDIKAVKQAQVKAVLNTVPAAIFGDNTPIKLPVVSVLFLVVGPSNSLAVFDEFSEAFEAKKLVNGELYRATKI